MGTDAPEPRASDWDMKPVLIISEHFGHLNLIPRLFSYSGSLALHRVGSQAADEVRSTPEGSSARDGTPTAEGHSDGRYFQRHRYHRPTLMRRMQEAQAAVLSAAAPVLQL